MALSIKNVAIAGATGNLGSSITKALVESRHFTVTALTRSTSTGKASLPAGVSASVVDYDDPALLAAALEGQDAVICALSGSAANHQFALLDAAVAAGVPRFLPAEFGSDTLNAHAAQLPVFAGKKAIEQSCATLAAAGKISYTLLMNGPLLDFGLESGFFGLDLRQRHARYLDGGNAVFSMSTRATVARAVVRILQMPEQTRNRAVYVQDAAMSLRQLVALAKTVVGSEGWTEVDGGTTAGVERASYEALGNGKKDMGVFVGFLLSAIFREGYGGRFQALDNALLGIPQMTEAQIVSVIRQVADR